MTGEKEAYRAMVDRVNSMRDDGSIPGEPKGKPSTIDSPFNACCYREQCKALEARALAAEAALAAERERCAKIVDEHARELMVYRDHHYVAKHLRSAAAAIRAEGE